MKKWELIILIALCLSVILTSFSSFSEVCAAVREDTLRLHILANSDTERDQQAKLYVRDEILRVHGDVFSQSLNKKGAVHKAQSIAAQIENTAREALQRSGLDYSVSAQVVSMYFTTTEYDGFTMPAGRYEALRVKLGKAEGKNWFCVMFPPLCVPAVRDEASPHYTAQEQGAVQSPYKLKFAVVEWLSAAKEAISGRK